MSSIKEESQRIVTEYTSYRKEVSVKIAQYDQLDEDLYRLKAENEELRARNSRMQNRLAAKELEIKQLGAEQ